MVRLTPYPMPMPPSIICAINGTAYANTGGWVNFNPTNVSGSAVADVTINTNGEFNGWTWLSGAYGGWIKFDCGNTGTCVRTDWQPVSERPVYGSYSQDGNGATTTGVQATSSVQIASSTPQQVDTMSHGGANLPSRSEGVGSPKMMSESTTGQISNDDLPVFDDSARDQDTGQEETQILEESEPSGEPEAVSEYRSVPMFGRAMSSDSKPDCLMCLVVHTDIDDSTSVLKWNFVPEIFELRIPISSIFSSQDEPGVPPVDVDATSVAVTSLISYGLVRFVLMNVFRLFVPV